MLRVKEPAPKGPVRVANLCADPPVESKPFGEVAGRYGFGA
jgi:hypothetical protein